MRTEEELHTLIDELISFRKEGLYWDFKQEFYSKDKLTDLLHDVTCLANVIHDGDRYIIFGINNRFEVIGIDKHEYDQQKITTYLRDRPYADQSFPKILFDDLTYGGKLIQILTIKNEPKKPYYFTEEIKAQNKTVMRAGAIYSRDNDSNTPKDSCAKSSDIEAMWKERFGLSLKIKDKFKTALKDYDKWQYNGVSAVYYIEDERMTLEASGDKEIKGDRWWTTKESPLNFSEFDFIMRSHTTIIEKIKTLYCYYENFYFPIPERECLAYPNAINGNNAQFYCDIYYYIKDTIKHSLLVHMIGNGDCIFNKDGLLTSARRDYNAIIKLPFFVIEEHDLDMLKQDYLDAQKEFLRLGLDRISILNNEKVRLRIEEKFSLWAFEKLYPKYSK